MMEYQDTVIHLYEDVYQKHRHAFPPHFFIGKEGMCYAAVITRYVLEQKVKWNREQICSSISHGFFARYRLAGMLNTYFKKSIFAALDNAYPGEFHPWEIVHARRMLFIGPFGHQMARRAVHWMVFEKLKFTEHDLNKITVKTFSHHGLGDMLYNVYQGSPLLALQDAGMYSYHPWEMQHTPNGYWKGEVGLTHAVEAVKWLVEEKLRVPIDEIPSRIRFRHFAESGLGTMIKSVFNGSPFQAMDAAYPGQFKKWQFSCVGKGYWSGEDGLQHAKEAMAWLIHDKLKITVAEIPLVIGVQTFKQYGLYGMFTKLFNRSVTKALDVLYPGQFTGADLLRAKQSCKKS